MEWFIGLVVAAVVAIIGAYLIGRWLDDEDQHMDRGYRKNKRR